MSISPSTDLLTLTDWQVRFPATAERATFAAVKGVSFAVGAGESLGIVGESGSGKSLTALSILKLLPKAAASAGEIHWRGQAIHALKEPAMNSIRGRQVSMIFQEPLSSLNPVLRCGEQVAEGLRTHFKCSKSEAKARTLAWLERVQLHDPQRVWSAFPHELSGGQRQRVMIAMALSTEPQLLIADEPTTALDVQVQRAILDLIQALQRELGLAILFISHDLAVVKEICQSVVVMRHGEVLEAGEVQQVFTQPQHPYTKGLLACHPSLTIPQRRLPTIAAFEQQPDLSPAAIIAQLRAAPGAYAQRQAFLRAAPTVLRVVNLRVWYASQRNFWGKATAHVKAVDDVSFDLRKGEIMGIVGESGSGKTTLGKAILRLVPIRSGAVWYEQQPLHQLSERELRPLRPNLQMVFQDPFNSLNPRMTIGQTLAEPLRIHQPTWSATERQARIESLLAKVGLTSDVLHRYPTAFSGGQRQRIGIARALLLEPDLLICDESVSALDVSVQAQVLNLLKDLQAELGFSLLFISHDLAVVKFLADRIMVMEKGKVVELNDTESLFAQPEMPYTQRLLASIIR
ncbi:MAG: ABC transporter ATP-binding protein [Bacteroidota bacterium]